MVAGIGMQVGGAGNSERDGVVPVESVWLDPGGVIGGVVMVVDAVLGVDEDEPL